MSHRVEHASMRLQHDHSHLHLENLQLRQCGKCKSSRRRMGMLMLESHAAMLCLCLIGSTSPAALPIHLHAASTVQHCRFWPLSSHVRVQEPMGKRQCHTYKGGSTGGHSSFKGSVEGIHSGPQLLWHNVGKHGTVVAATPASNQISECCWVLQSRCRGLRSLCSKQLVMLCRCASNRAACRSELLSWSCSSISMHNSC